MSATLTWYNSGLGTKTNTTVAAYYTDFKTLMDSKSGDANFTWEVQASNLGSSPYYVWLRRKDASNGRILIVTYTGAPAGNNTAIFNGAPATNAIFSAFFPNGTASSPSNLSASSGSISGDDTDCTMAASFGSISNNYGASLQHYYFDCYDGIISLTQNPASTNFFGGAVGLLAVDGADDAHSIVVGGNTISWDAFGTSTWIIYTAAGHAAGSANAYMKSSYASQASDISWYPAWFTPVWSSQTIGVNDILTDTSNTDAWFVPMPLVACKIKGGGFPLKLRQIGFGPQSLGQFSIYNETGPVVKARCLAATTATDTGVPWVTNFKI